MAVYARPPKVSRPGDGTIAVKINSALFESASAHAAEGIPVLAGVPRVSSLLDFSLSCECLWFEIHSIPGLPPDVEFSLASAGEVSPVIAQGVAGPLTREYMVKTVQARCRVTPWSDAVARIQVVRRTCRQYEGGLWGLGQYRPFYVALVALRDD
jgi:hypothetical protein